MWDPENFPGADNVPWPLLIRARYQFEVDAHIASSVVAAVARFGSDEMTAKVAEAADGAVRGSMAERAELNAEQRMAFLGAVADWEDGELCPRWWRWPFPWPPRKDDAHGLADPIAYVALQRGLDLITAAGSPQLRESLGGAIQGMQG